MKKVKRFVRSLDAVTAWKRQPRDASGRWVKGGTRLSEAIKNTAKKEKLRDSYKTNKKERANQTVKPDNKFSKTSTKPLKISKRRLKDVVAQAVGKKEAAKLDKDFNEVYKPSPEVAAKFKSKTASPRGVDNLIDKEAHTPYMKAAKAYLIKDGEKFSEKDVKNLAYDYASNARSQEFDKIRAITKEEYIFKTKKGEVELDTEDIYQGKWVNQYKVRNDTGKVIDKGLFRTADELKKVLED